MSRPSPARPGNQLLACLPPKEYGRLAPHLQAVTLKFRQVIYEARSAVDHAYFPTEGVLSALIIMEDGGAIEVATIGNEGVVGLPVFLGSVTSTNQVIVQVAGAALRVKGRMLQEQASRDCPLRRVLLNYQSAFLSQVSQGVACNGLHSIHQRCCRWLLMTQDRVNTDEFRLTHEFLAIMLGVRRASVSEVLEPLQEEGLIRNWRGKFRILDRNGLKASSCECYSTVNEVFERLLPAAVL
jgi:CRP-like cAMP-binding protein